MREGVEYSPLYNDINNTRSTNSCYTATSYYNLPTFFTMGMFFISFLPPRLHPSRGPNFPPNANLPPLYSSFLPRSPLPLRPGFCWKCIRNKACPSHDAGYNQTSYHSRNTSLPPQGYYTYEQYQTLPQYRQPRTRSTVPRRRATKMRETVDPSSNTNFYEGQAVSPNQRVAFGGR